MEQPKDFYEGDEHFKELKRTYDRHVTGENFMEIMDLTARFLSKMKHDYPDVELYKYKLYHILGHSGFREEQVPYYDLEKGEIEEYINDPLGFFLKQD